MRKIILNKGVALVDDEDHELVSRHKWRKVKRRNTYYAITSIINNNKKVILTMHRLIVGKPPLRLVTDHINGNGLDNRKINLRFCTNAQNIMNTPKRIGSGRFKGIFFQKSRTNPWNARIYCNGKCIYLGCFKEEVNAALAYNSAAKKYFGEFARPNII